MNQKGNDIVDGNAKQGKDFEKEFIRKQLTKVAENAAKVGISPEIFEAWLCTLADEMDFKDIMKISKENVQ